MCYVCKVEIVAIIGIGVALRSIVSQYSYSGERSPPMFGDYEAQRHWQEITININVTDWYKNGTSNDLLYWGLDYPPLSAYHSYLMGLAANLINESYVTLKTSRGYESKAHKDFMRLTVLISDFVIYIPSILILSISLDKMLRKKIFSSIFLLYIIYPGQILIDNGHFQYNNISLGLTAIAISAILHDHHNIAAIFYSMALNYKQMELYHAMPFFFYLLAICNSTKSFSAKIRQFFKFAAITATTFIIIWLPWTTSFENFTSVVSRLFPFGRGVFEDKVSNFWCITEVFYKLRNMVSNQNMALLCLFSTLSITLPTNIWLFIKCNKKHFLFTIFITALAFYLFSFQVHEKSILLAVLPAFSIFYWLPVHMIWFMQLSVISMFPLLWKDGLTLPFFALMAIFNLTFYCISFTQPFKENICSDVQFPGIKLINFSVYKGILLTILALYIPTPTRYPHIWELIICCYSCAHFLIILFVLFMYIRKKIT